MITTYYQQTHTLKQTTIRCYQVLLSLAQQPWPCTAHGLMKIKANSRCAWEAHAAIAVQHQSTNPFQAERLHRIKIKAQFWVTKYCSAAQQPWAMGHGQIKNQSKQLLCFGSTPSHSSPTSKHQPFSSRAASLVQNQSTIWVCQVLLRSTRALV